MITFDKAAKNLVEVGKYAGITLEQAGKNITDNLTTICRKCGGACKPGKALDNTFVDLGKKWGNEVALEKFGPPVMVDCMKCERCGHSFTPPTTPAAPASPFPPVPPA